MVFNRESLLKELELKSEEVSIGEGTVIVSEIGAVDYFKLWTDPKNQIEVGKELVDGKEVPKTEVNMARFNPSVVAYSCKDENGNRIFTDDDIDLLANSAKGPFLKIVNAAFKLNGLDGESAKNSENNLTESSSSGCVSN
jgi:hypothetical protein